MSDREALLIERIRARDESALAEYIDLKRPQLLAFIARNLSGPLRAKVEPEDLLSEAALSAVNSLAEIDLSQREPFGWLCHVCERRIIDAHRHYLGAAKRSARREVGLDAGRDEPGRGGFLDVLVASMTSPSAAFSRDQREFKLAQALDQLPEEQREALRLRYVEGLPTKEIADRIGKTDGAVRVMLSRTMVKLQELLADDPAFEQFRQEPPPP